MVQTYNVLHTVSKFPRKLAILRDRRKGQKCLIQWRVRSGDPPFKSEQLYFVLILSIFIPIKGGLWWTKNVIYSERFKFVESLKPQVR